MSGKRYNQANIIFEEMQNQESSEANLVGKATELVKKENGSAELAGDVGEQNNKTSENIGEQELNFEKALEILGIKLTQDDHKTAILDYSQCVKNFNNILERDKVKRKIIKESLDVENNKTTLSAIDDIEKNWDELRDYFKALISFFTNPPSKEIFELTNHNALLNSVYQSFKKFEQDFEDLNLTQNMSSKIRALNDRISELDNFNKQIEAKTEHSFQFYSTFIDELSKNQQEKLSNFIEKTEGIKQKMKDLFNSYDKSMSERLKFYKGGSKWLSIISLLLALGCGGLAFFTLSLSNEISTQGAILKQLGDIGVEQTNKEVKFELPKNARYLKKDDKTYIIIDK